MTEAHISTDGGDQRSKTVHHHPSWLRRQQTETITKNRGMNFGQNIYLSLVYTIQHFLRERLSTLDGDGKIPLKPIIHFQTWRVGILFFIIGNCLNFVSFGYAAQSLLAALGSIRFLSNIAFAYFVLNKMVTVKYVKVRSKTESRKFDLRSDAMDPSRSS